MFTADSVECHQPSHCFLSLCCQCSQCWWIYFSWRWTETSWWQEEPVALAKLLSGMRGSCLQSSFLILFQSCLVSRGQSLLHWYQWRAGTEDSPGSGWSVWCRESRVQCSWCAEHGELETSLDQSRDILLWHWRRGGSRQQCWSLPEWWPGLEEERDWCQHHWSHAWHWACSGEDEDWSHCSGVAHSCFSSIISYSCCVRLDLWPPWWGALLMVSTPHLSTQCMVWWDNMGSSNRAGLESGCWDCVHTSVILLSSGQ